MSLTPEQFERISGRNVLIVEPLTMTPHLETGFEIAERLAERNRVTYIGADALRTVTDENFKLATRVLNNFSRKRMPSRQLSDAVRCLTGRELQDRYPVGDLGALPELSALQSEQARTVKWQNFDVGMGVLSSLISLTRQIEPDFAAHAKFVAKLTRDSISTYVLTKTAIERDQFDLIIFFNGRLAPVRAVRRACDATGTEFLVHERASSSGKFGLFMNAVPHQPTAYRSWVDNWWDATEQPDLRAREWVAKRRKGIPTDWYSFIGAQVKGNAPVQNPKRRITFFTSSEDELVSIGDELSADSPFCDQAFSIEILGRLCREKGYDFFVRFHPNTPPSEVRLADACARVGATMFEPNSDVDTYALIDSSDIVITQSSTVGIEAAVGGKPAFYTGRNLYETCRAVRRIRTMEDLAAALEVEDLGNGEDALRFANFFGTHGIPYELFEPSGIVSGRYRGRDMNAPFTAARSLKLRLKRGGI